MEVGDSETQGILRELATFGPSSSTQYLAGGRRHRKINEDFEKKLNSVNLRFERKQTQLDVDAASSSSQKGRTEIGKEDILKWKKQVLQASRPINQWSENRSTAKQQGFDRMRATSSSASDNRVYHSSYAGNDAKTVCGENMIFSATGARKSVRNHKQDLSAEIADRAWNKNGSEPVYHARLCHIDAFDNGICAICGAELYEKSEVVHALDKVFHSSCLICDLCGRTLKDKKFYKVAEKYFCEEDYLYAGMQLTAEQCSSCSHPIISEVLYAFGKSYHPRCFRCKKCKKCLDGIPFALDQQENVYCMDDYHKIYAPVCAACKGPIIPLNGTGKTVRVEAKGRNYHIECYVCEGCCCQLTDEPNSRCYPLSDHLLCKKCHILWKRTGGAEHIITDL